MPARRVAHLSHRYRKLGETAMDLSQLKNIPGLNAQSLVTRAQDDAVTQMQALTTGERSFAGAALDAGRGLSASARNAVQTDSSTVDAQSALQTVAGALEQIGGMLTQMSGFASQAASPALPDAERAVLGDRFAQTRADLDRVATTTAYRGASLLTGAALRLQMEPKHDASRETQVRLPDASAAGLRLDSATLDDAAAAQRALDYTTAAQGGIEAAKNSVVAAWKSLMSSTDNLTVQLNAQLQGRVGDAAFASATTAQAQTQIAQGAGAALAAQANTEPSQALALLTGR